jgi:peptide/nickel transport system substrate-binding protein
MLQAKILMMLLGLILVLVVACGGAPAAPEATTAPVTEPTAAPIEGDTSQPTSTPQMAPAPAEVEVNPGKLTIMVGDFGNERFDTLLAPSAIGGTNYSRIMGGYLISANEKMEMVPGIAKEWGISPDGLTWTFIIREGVKFHDDSEVTPEDALWTLQHYFGPQAVEYSTRTDTQAISRVMDKIELSAPDTVSVTAQKPVVELAYLLAEAGDKWFHVFPKRSALGDPQEALAYDNNPISAGPMSLAERVPASVMKFERFADYYYQPANGFPEDKRMKFQSLDLFLVPEEATRVAAIRAGETDLAPVSLPAKEQVEAGGGRVVFAQEGVFIQAMLIGCWADPSFPCGDKRVRQALDYAIDKELIRDRLFGGPEVFQVKGWYVFTPSTIGYTPELDPWPYDPEKARQLLAEAGYPDGQGFGKLILNTYPSTSMPFLVESAQLGAEFWRRELGLDVEVNVSDSVAMDEKENAGELNGQILWRDNETRVDATSSIISGYGDRTRGTRKHDDPELFRVVQETVTILDPDKRAEAYKQLARRLREETHYLGIGYANIPWAVASRIETWEPYPLSLFPSALHTITLK